MTSEWTGQDGEQGYPGHPGDAGGAGGIGGAGGAGGKGAPEGGGGLGGAGGSGGAGGTSTAETPHERDVKADLLKTEREDKAAALAKEFRRFSWEVRIYYAALFLYLVIKEVAK